MNINKLLKEIDAVLTNNKITVFTGTFEFADDRFKVEYHKEESLRGTVIQTKTSGFDSSDSEQSQL